MPKKPYIIRDADDTVLYVGISENPWRRVRDHLRRQDFGDKIYNLTVQELGEGETPLDAEARLIAELKPVFNRNDGGDGKRKTTGAGIVVGKKKYLLVAPEDDFAAWQAAAQAEGVSLAAWIRRRLNGTLAGEDGRADLLRRPSVPASASCQHGLPAGFCLNPACK